LHQAILMNVSAFADVPSGRLDDLARQGTLTKMEQPTEVAAQASSRDPAIGLRAVASLRALLESLEALQVKRARESGWSWQDIATALGVTKQAAHEKHGAGRRGRRKRRP
jgi:hypothetical protein